MNILVVIDMQNDFITGPLGTPEAVAIVPKVKQKIEEYHKRGETVIFTRDTHWNNYKTTLEGRKLPIEHCIYGSHGWMIADGLINRNFAYLNFIINKEKFGYDLWVNHLIPQCQVELVGVCTDICVIANALAMQTLIPEIDITVDASCCAGTTPEKHKAALEVMKSCQINVINE